jgi:hypothetical protein
VKKAIAIGVLLWWLWPRREESAGVTLNYGGRAEYYPPRPIAHIPDPVLESRRFEPYPWEEAGLWPEPWAGL